MIKLSKINFRDFRSCQDLIDFLDGNGINRIVDDLNDGGREYRLSDVFDLWEKYNLLFEK